MTEKYEQKHQDNITLAQEIEDRTTFKISGIWVNMTEVGIISCTFR